MQGMDFVDAVTRIRRRDPRFTPTAYAFLREALDHTVETRRAGAVGARRHVSGRELCEGFRELALQRFGPMAATVVEAWGIRSTEDIGAMVYHLIAEEILRASPEDRPEDFVGVFDFDSAFRFPFLPQNLGRRSARAARRRKESAQ